jgi:RNA recognition motif-containing protein
MGHLVPPIAPSTPGQNPDDEIIPTAIVIKNIPFNVKRETLLDIIASLSIPTPYAFNYHLDQQGSFRGLAFANFRQAIDADAVVAALNGFDVQGRKLRVEYKKVLQAGEKERIEREKAIRRMRSMQLEKEQQAVAAASVHPGYDDFGPIAAPSFTPQRSFSTGAAYQQPQYSPPSVPPLPISQSFNPPTSPPVAPVTPNPSEKASLSNELDLNDPSTLEIYSRILLFKDDRMRDELAFSRTLTPKQRRVVHLIAQKLGVYHYSVGEGDERYAVVTRIDPNRRAQPPTLSRAPSAYLSASSSQSQLANTLRMKKSMPDMKTLHMQAPRLTTRASNGNIREGYATIASPSRRSPGGFGSLFGSGTFGTSGPLPPVPSLPSSVTGSLNGNLNESSGHGVLRQPRGPGISGFSVRRTNTDVQARGNGLEARTHEPLEI